MTRFQDLADAYGGDIGRWPAEVRSEARVLLANHREAARILARAAEDDALLNACRPSVPSAALRDALIAAAPRPRGAGIGGFAWGRLFLPGAGLAAAGAAGLIFGAVLYARVEQAAQTDAAVDSALIDNSAAGDEIGVPLTVSQAASARRA